MSSEPNNTNETPKRKRKVTQIAMDWLTDRLRKCESIKKQVSSGCYQVDSCKVAQSILNEKG